MLHRPVHCVDEVDVALLIAHGNLREGMNQKIIIDIHSNVTLTHIPLLFGLQFKHLKRTFTEPLDELIDATLAVSRGLDLCTAVGIRFLLAPCLLEAAEASKIALDNLLLLARSTP